MFSGVWNDFFLDVRGFVLYVWGVIFLDEVEGSLGFRVGFCRKLVKRMFRLKINRGWVVVFRNFLVVGVFVIVFGCRVLR